MKTLEFCFLGTRLRRDTHPLFSIENNHSYSSTKITSSHKLSKLNYLKPILSLRKVDFEKLDPIHSTHISADAPIHAKSESVFFFVVKCLARLIVNDSGAQISIWASLPPTYATVRRPASSV